jgi:hypothetical protein
MAGANRQDRPERTQIHSQAYALNLALKNAAVAY